MRRLVAMSLLVLFAAAGAAEARRVRRTVVVRGPRVKVTVHSSFPIRRPLPAVVVRPAPVVRVRPLVYLPAVVFTAAVVATIPPAVDWRQSEYLDREDGWTDFTMNVDRRGRQLLLQITDGPAQLNFAEIVFDNGDTQVVDFNERAHRTGTYSLLDFKDGRKVDHVRIVAKASGDDTQITLHLAS